MEKWLKDYRYEKKKAEREALRPIDDEKVEIYRINQINRIEEQIAILKDKIRILDLDLKALKRSE